MANDSFLKGWLEGESVGEPDSEDLIEYLYGLKLKYDYNSVFVISEKAKDYYHYKGEHKTIDPSDLHDQWYYNFIASKALKDQGIVSRWGGDEYVGIIYEDIETASQLISTLQENVAKDQNLSEYSVTISIGITASKHTDTPDIVMGRIDKGLYQSKEMRKNCISVV
jgi:hypothetical protein